MAPAHTVVTRQENAVSSDRARHVTWRAAITVTQSADTPEPP
jgi:hypothetical protein